MSRLLLISITAEADSVSEPLALAYSAPITVRVLPGEGGTARIETSISSHSKIKSGTAVWLPWAAGDVGALTEDVTVGPINGLRLAATGAAASAEVLQ